MMIFFLTIKYDDTHVSNEIFLKKLSILFFRIKYAFRLYKIGENEKT
jgi:hypothetical protein